MSERPKTVSEAATAVVSSLVSCSEHDVNLAHLGEGGHDRYVAITRSCIPQSLGGSSHRFSVAWTTRAAGAEYVIAFDGRVSVHRKISSKVARAVVSRLLP